MRSLYSWVTHLSLLSGRLGAFPFCMHGHIYCVIKKKKKKNPYGTRRTMLWLLLWRSQRKHVSGCLLNTSQQGRQFGFCLFWILLLCCTLLLLDAHLVISLSHSELLDEEPKRAHQLTISHPAPCFGWIETSVMVKKSHFHLPFPSIITSLGLKGISKRSGCLPKQLVHKQPIPHQTTGSSGCWALSICCPAQYTAGLPRHRQHETWGCKAKEITSAWNGRGLVISKWTRPRALPVGGHKGAGQKRSWYLL